MAVNFPAPARDEGNLTQRTDTSSPSTPQPVLKALIGFLPLNPTNILRGKIKKDKSVPLLTAFPTKQRSAGAKPPWIFYSCYKITSPPAAVKPYTTPHISLSCSKTTKSFPSKAPFYFKLGEWKKKVIKSIKSPVKGKT